MDGLVFSIHLVLVSVFGFQGTDITLVEIYFEVYPLLGLSGLEPPTSRLSGVRSNRLSYKPIEGLYEDSFFGFFQKFVPAATCSPITSPA